MCGEWRGRRGRKNKFLGLVHSVVSTLGDLLPAVVLSTGTFGLEDLFPSCLWSSVETEPAERAEREKRNDFHLFY